MTAERAPVRIQRKRTKGWRMPEGAVYVGRPTMWGNHAAAACGVEDRAAAVAVFRQWVDEVASWAWKSRAAIDLRGKDLACWCPLPGPEQPDHCHAAVLLELANR